MVPLPKRRHSTRRGGKRKASISLPLVGLTKCAQCGKLIRPHTACNNCGYYAGRQVIIK